MIIQAIRSLLPVLLKSAKYTPNMNQLTNLSRLINRMKVLARGSQKATSRELATRAVQEYERDGVNTLAEQFYRVWNWTKEDLTRALELLYNSGKW